MKKLMLGLFLGFSLFLSVLSFLQAEEDDYCYQFLDKCREEVITRNAGWIATAMALQACEVLFYQCIVIKILKNIFL